MIASVLNLLQLVAALSDRGQHQIVSHYLHGFKNYEFWKRGTRFVTLKSHCVVSILNYLSTSASRQHTLVLVLVSVTAKDYLE